MFLYNININKLGYKLEANTYQDKLVQIVCFFRTIKKNIIS